MRALLAAVCLGSVACGGVTESHDGFKGDITISQPLSQVPVNGIACRNPAGFITETSYMRAYHLADYDILGSFRVTHVRFVAGARVVGSGSTSFPIQVSIHDYTGEVGGSTIDDRDVSPALSTVEVSMRAGTSPTTFEPEITAEIGAPSFLVKIHVPDYTGAMHNFSIATSDQGDEQPSYIQCAANAPRTPEAAGFPSHALLITVSGTSY